MITAEQRQRRRQGIGASDAAAIVLGDDGFRTSLDVYAEKVFDLPDESDDQRAAGNILEPAIRELAARKLGVPIVPSPSTLVHPTRPWMIAHLDGEAGDGGVFEAKALDWRKAKLLGPEGTDACLRPHLVQVQHQLEVTGKPWGHVGYLVGPYDLRLYLVVRDEELGGMIAEAVTRFWHENVLARVPPEAESGEAQLRYNARAFSKGSSERLYADPGTPADEALRDLARARAATKAAKEIEKLAAARVQSLMGNARRIDCSFGHVTWSRGKSTAWASVVRELGGAPRALIDKHTKPSARFLPSFDGDAGAESPTEEE